MTKALQTNCPTLDHSCGVVIQAIFLSLSILVFLGSQCFLGCMELTINRLEIYKRFERPDFQQYWFIIALVVFKMFL